MRLAALQAFIYDLLLRATQGAAIPRIMLQKFRVGFFLQKAEFFFLMA